RQALILPTRDPFRPGMGGGGKGLRDYLFFTAQIKTSVKKKEIIPKQGKVFLLRSTAARFYMAWDLQVSSTIWHLGVQRQTTAVASSRKEKKSWKIHLRTCRWIGQKIERKRDTAFKAYKL
ncbi:hypothetical protein ACJX0J_028086, partial [Zea mays]